MAPLLAPVLALLAATPAWSIELTTHSSTLISPVSGSYYENGVGHPAVAYDSDSSQYVMLFETRLDTASNCDAGLWGLGMATSTDGTTWTVSADPVLEPTDGTYYSCVAAHPTVIYDGSTWHIWFKAEQANDACDEADTGDTADTGSGEPSWGCERYTGVGYATWDGSSTTLTASSEPALATTETFGYPATARVDSTWYMMLAKVPSIYLATATDPEGPYTMETDPVLEPSYITWAEDRFYNPVLQCYDPDLRFSFEMFLGGKDLDSSGAYYEGGWGAAVSDDAEEWFVRATPYESWTTSPDWRHWDVLRVDNSSGDPDYLVYFAEAGSSGNQVGLAYTSSSWAPGQITDRLCGKTSGKSSASGLWEDDLDMFVDESGNPPSVFDDPADSEASTDPGYSPDDPAACGCSSGVAGAAAWLLAPLLLLGRRRR